LLAWVSTYSIKKAGDELGTSEYLIAAGSIPNALKKTKQNKSKNQPSHI
jgi:hypothetical protein